MSYGEGAGTRRKLIKNTVEQRSKDPVYKEAFEKALSNEDMAKHAQQAKTERKLKDAKNTAEKTGRGIVNLLTGHTERLGAGMAAIAAAATIAHQTGADKVIIEQGKKLYHAVVNDITIEKGKQAMEKIFGRK